MIGSRLLASMVLLAAAAPALAVETGLESIVITPTEMPEDSRAVIEFLESHGGFLDAAWDTSRDAWVVPVEDSIRVAPRTLVEGVEALDVGVKNLRFEFREAYARVHPDQNGMSQAYVVSPANDMELVMAPTMHARRLWTFLGRTREPDPGLELWCDIYLGMPDSAGVYAPDTADVKRFLLSEQKD